MAPLSRRTEAQSSKRAAVEASVVLATEQLLGEGASYPDLSVEQIATRAGISRTAFYFYFRDKRELLMRLTDGVAEQLYATAEHWWEGEGDDGDGAVEQSAALTSVVGI
jgi:AcrR family transcriptional regulator